MPTPILGPATVIRRATVEVPLITDNEESEIHLREDNDKREKRRLFVVDRVTLTCMQEYTEADSADEGVTPWDVTAVASGRMITGGTVGNRRLSRTFHDDPAADEPTLPAWLGEIIERYHPRKLS
jgi:hypothetical protein